MDQAGIIQDLLSWLEGHLDTPLSLDRVAERSGYSKWHLQRKFKLATGQAIGAYIRARRLSRCSTASTRNKPSPAHSKSNLFKRRRFIAVHANGISRACIRRTVSTAGLCPRRSSLRCRQ